MTQGFRRASLALPELTSCDGFLTDKVAIGFLTGDLRENERILTSCRQECYALQKVSVSNSEIAQHVSVLLHEVTSFMPEQAAGTLLDVTAGGGGHFFHLLKARENWRGECWDRDPEAEARIRAAATLRGVAEARYDFRRRRFGEGPPEGAPLYNYILADIGVSSFQLDDPSRGMSFRSESPPDFRMDPSTGLPFLAWLRQTPEFELARIFDHYGEEPKAKKIAHAMKEWREDAFVSARVLAERVKQTLRYPEPSRVHPSTRVFQALRIAINDELGELNRLLQWAPAQLAPGGRLAVISFHSLEDRQVKNAFRGLAAGGGFDILTKKPLAPTPEEETLNPRSRSAKLRVIERSVESPT
jgi:16S rRNA (cytosine1402-N4)-methyltransferase